MFKYKNVVRSIKMSRQHRKPKNQQEKDFKIQQLRLLDRNNLRNNDLVFLRFKAKNTKDAIEKKLREDALWITGSAYNTIESQEAEVFLQKYDNTHYGNHYELMDTINLSNDNLCFDDVNCIYEDEL